MSIYRLTLTLAAAVAAVFASPYGASADTFGSGDNQFEIEFVTIGNPGNRLDTSGNPRFTGRVDYEYRIAKYEISRDIIEMANTQGGLGIALDGLFFCGPTVLRPDMPATGVSWNEAARFVNWLNESEGFSPAYKFATQPGEGGYSPYANIELWQPEDAGYDANNLFRNTHAQYFLPSVSEWYKAAYYDPEANEGLGGYWNYPTGSDSPPLPVASGTAAATAVYDQPCEQGPADVTLAGGLSPYGTMAQGGNVFEWEETEFDLKNDGVSSILRGNSRGVRGGEWGLFSAVDDFLSSSKRTSVIPEPTGENVSLGIRVASMPKPNACDLNNDGALDADDINELTASVAIGSTESKYDLDMNGLVNADDITYWAHDCYGAYIGDADLDQDFDSDDLNTVIAALTYEANIQAVWTTGDWDGSGRFDSDDLIAALADAGYERGPYPNGGAMAAAPEPSSLWLAALGITGLLLRRGGTR